VKLCQGPDCPGNLHFTTFKPSMHIASKVDIAITVKNANSCKTGYRAKESHSKVRDRYFIFKIRFRLAQ
jgi:hypothetical protein